jgi:hypothetical protein
MWEDRSQQLESVMFLTSNSLMLRGARSDVDVQPFEADATRTLTIDRPPVLAGRINAQPRLAARYTPSRLAKELPFELAPRRPLFARKKTMFKDYIAGLQQVAAARRELAELGNAIVLANFGGNGAALLRFEWPVGGALTNVETAMRPLNVLYPALVEDLERQRRPLVAQVESMFEQLVAQLLCGLIEWHADDVARYVYCLRNVSVSSVARQVIESAGFITTQMDHSRVTTHSMVFHDLIEARAHPLPAKHVARPRRVDDLIACIPKWLRSFVRIVDGVEIRSETIELYRHEERWTETNTVAKPAAYQYDPALVIGDYVLTGWEPGER